MVDLKIVTVVENKVTPSINMFSRTEGREALAQRIVKLLLTTKGSDYFNDNLGSSLLNLYGVYTENNIDSIKMTISTMLKSFTDNLKQEQAKDILNGVYYSNEDLLEDIYINSIEFDKAATGWKIALQIINKAHNSIRIVVP